jgi:acid phosphatase type 7
VNGSRTVRRDIPLVLIVFVATLVVLAGSWSILGRASSRSTPAATPPAGASGIAVGGSASGNSSAASPGPVSSGGIAPDATPLVPVLTPGPSGEVPTVTLTGAGDIAVCDSDGAKLTSDLMLRQPGWFFTIGDNAYENGRPGDFAKCYAPTWGRILDRTILPVIGNHDWLTKDASGYLDYFGARATPTGNDYYSMDLGGWHIVVLDSDCAKVGGCKPGTPQGDWLAQDLASSTAHCTLALWHHPRFSSGEHGDQLQVAPFWQMLYDAHADLILNGHDHDYERFAPMDPSGKETRPNGIREIVVGTGGGALREFHEIQPNSEFRLQKVFGVLQLTLHPASYDWQFMPADGSQITDAGSTPCH